MMLKATMIITAANITAIISNRNEEVMIAIVMII